MVVFHGAAYVAWYAHGREYIVIADLHTADLNTGGSICGRETGFDASKCFGQVGLHKWVFTGYNYSWQLC